MNDVTVLIVPGLRDRVEQHWQTLLEAKLRASGRPVAALMPPGREDLQCAARVAAIDAALRAITGPVVIVAHSAGCVMVAHWVHWARSAQSAQPMRRGIRGALLAAPADFELAMPDGYPTLEQLDAGGWLPVPRARLPFRSIVAASSNDPLGGHQRIAELAQAWGSERVDLGAVGHLNPASGYGEWPRALAFIDQLSTARAAA